jgi:acyl CoA:acetate/3-ketoacid CoA transferase beta subunit
MLTREQIATRAARELKSGETVQLGASIAQLLATQLPAGVVLSDGREAADVAVITAREVCATGELAGADSTPNAKRVIALIEQHQSDDGTFHVRKACSDAVTGRATRVITNLAIFDVTPDGLVMREVAQGVSALDVQLKSELPLLAADDLKVIEL